MHLLRVARGIWDVQVICDAEGDSPTLDFLEALQNGAYRAASDWMLNAIKYTMPAGDPRSIPMPLCKALGGGLFEFRKNPKGKKVRLVWFCDIERIVVCASAFLKDDKTGPVQIARARALQQQYFDEQRRGLNRVIDLES